MKGGNTIALCTINSLPEKLQKKVAACGKNESKIIRDILCDHYNVDKGSMSVLETHQFLNSKLQADADKRNESKFYRPVSRYDVFTEIIADHFKGE